MSQAQAQPLNSNPEILLRKRRNADRTRLEKQELAKKKKEQEEKRKRSKKNRFVRAESIVATSLATEREKTRIRRIRDLENKKTIKDLSHVPSDRNFILRITERTKDSANGEDELVDVDEDDEEDDGLLREKIVYNGEPTLLFVIRVKGPTAVKIPAKAFKVLTLLRLVELNTGVFIKLTKDVYPLLKLVSPYIVIGQPSPASIRSLIQKRSRIMWQRPEDKEPKEIILNDNNIVEEKLGSEGIICIEDIIHEISTLGESFAKCTFFLLPFKLNREVSGFSAISRLNKLKSREQDKKTRQISNAATAPVIQVDIDAMISKLN
ncbi:ribosome biogenesis protein RLP7 [Kluyveromyces marxianus DMKU3-1042]|uniref:Ribosome biogenesis protein RLP7 n=1 Tax=Kluyveromyces marxianus (strain DMKU3-1042 / BCC 29191 / NBRC 104275) TaxID=1003335 RepID=W0T6A9_KLUMD|nr:ribosome biogenesis protein RLP7 [Kluyveromyces marxianus DMKU3-1042]BAO38940.1 ribosome biogenesis protein RLP7 [Kluyveromyces marxianus DMKU3-1042]